MRENGVTLWLAQCGIDKVQATKHGAKAACPFHADTGMSFAITRRKFICFSSRCGERGTLEELGARLGVPVPEHVLAEQDSESRDAPLTEIPKYLLEAYPIPFDRLRLRGIPDEETIAWDLRWDTRKNALLIPVHDPEGRVVSCAWRYDTGSMRYQNMVGLPRDQLLYGLHRAADTNRPLVLVEGFGDVWRNVANGLQSVSTFGAATTTGQAQLIAERGFYQVLLMYDNDEAGMVGALRAYKQLENLVDVKFAMRYQGMWPKDPGDADRTSAHRLVEEAMTCSEFCRFLDVWRTTRSYTFPASCLDRQHDFGYTV